MHALRYKMYYTGLLYACSMVYNSLLLYYSFLSPFFCDVSVASGALLHFVFIWPCVLYDWLTNSQIRLQDPVLDW